MGTGSQHPPTTRGRTLREKAGEMRERERRPGGVVRGRRRDEKGRGRGGKGGRLVRARIELYTPPSSITSSPAPRPGPACRSLCPRVPARGSNFWRRRVRRSARFPVGATNVGPPRARTERGHGPRPVPPLSIAFVLPPPPPPRAVPPPPRSGSLYTHGERRPNETEVVVCQDRERDSPASVWAAHVACPPWPDEPPALPVAPRPPQYQPARSLPRAGRDRVPI